MFDKFFKKNIAIESHDSPLLKVMVKDSHIADLYFDGTDYCLTYKEAFKILALPPLNPENDLKSTEDVVIDKCYKSKSLWYVFQERLFSLDRDDIVKELAQYGLNKNSNPLLILGNLGRSSISKPWSLTLVKKAK